MYRSMYLSIVVTVVFPMQTLAAVQTAVDSQADGIAWKNVSESLEQQSQLEAVEMNYQMSERLFPEAEEKDDRTTLEKLRHERTSDFVSVMIDGSSVIFYDVSRMSWFAPYVREIAEQGIVSGYRGQDGRPTGAFGPQDNVTVEQMAKVMVYGSGIDTSSCGSTALNVTASGSWSAPFVACAEKAQWAIYADGSIDVHRNATRAEVIMTLLEAFNVQPSERTGMEFTDVTTSTQFGSAIERAKRDGIVSGYANNDGMPNGLFGPDDPVTRAELAKIVTIGLQLYKK